MELKKQETGLRQSWQNATILAHIIQRNRIDTLQLDCC